MAKNGRFLLSLLLLAGTALPGAAQTTLRDNAPCFDEYGEPQARVANCTKLLVQRAGDPADLAKIYSNRGVGLGQLGEVKRALADLDRAVSIKPDDATIRNNRCYYRAVDGQIQKALEDCEVSVKLQKPGAMVLDSRAYAHLRAGNLDQALKDYEAVLLIEPAYATAIWGRGLIRWRKGDTVRGREDMELAAILNPRIESHMAAIGLKKPAAVSVGSN